MSEKRTCCRSFEGEYHLFDCPEVQRRMDIDGECFQLKDGTFLEIEDVERDFL